ncbi:hypothetical protein SAMN05421827_11839 [Pedobacter terrae]|uniref:Uncharacterized protein n=2 Tax=Pedobacter terrae TaxID=405671 RepID=A0A1G8A8I4_9SPHI|nr:hypothetical protein SAMN05421827_11839 [Pedobacter terrae]
MKFFMNQNIVKWLRWLFLLPVSILMTAVIFYLPELLPGIIVSKNSAKNVMHVLSPFFTSIISILSAHVIAPNDKFKASLVIGLIWLLILSIALSIVIFKVKFYGQHQYILDGGMALISAVTGIAIALLMSWKLQNLQRNK